MFPLEWKPAGRRCSSVGFGYPFSQVSTISASVPLWSRHMELFHGHNLPSRGDLKRPVQYSDA